MTPTQRMWHRVCALLDAVYGVPGEEAAARCRRLARVEAYLVRRAGRPTAAG